MRSRLGSGGRRLNTPALIVALAVAALGSVVAPSGAAAAPIYLTRGPDAPDAMVEALDVPYGTDANQMMDIRWRSDLPPAPVILVVRGGWDGDENAFADIATDLVTEGFASAALDMRDYGAPVHPAQLRDVRSAIEFLQANAGLYHLDATPVALLGNSLGGWVTGLMAIQEKLRPVTVVLWSGLLDPATYPDLGVGERLFGCSLAECPATWTSGSPLARVTPDDAPMFFAQSPDEKVPRDQGERMDAALTAAGVEHVFRLMPPGSGHGRQYADLVWDETIDWLWDHLSGP